MQVVLFEDVEQYVHAYAEGGGAQLALVSAYFALLGVRCPIASPEQAPTHQSMSLVKFVGVVLDPSTTVWKSNSELRHLNAIEQTQEEMQPRVDGVRFTRHRADAVTGKASRQWLGAPEI